MCEWHVQMHCGVACLGGGIGCIFPWSGVLITRIGKLHCIGTCRLSLGLLYWGYHVGFWRTRETLCMFMTSWVALIYYYYCRRRGQIVLGKHWRGTNMSAHYQWSPEKDHDFLRDSPLMEFQLEVCQASKWRGDDPVILAKRTTLARGTRKDSNLLQVEGCQANTN